MTSREHGNSRLGCGRAVVCKAQPKSQLHLSPHLPLARDAEISPTPRSQDLRPAMKLSP